MSATRVTGRIPVIRAARIARNGQRWWRKSPLDLVELDVPVQERYPNSEHVETHGCCWLRAVADHGESVYS